MMVNATNYTIAEMIDIALLFCISIIFVCSHSTKHYANSQSRRRRRERVKVAKTMHVLNASVPIIIREESRELHKIMCLEALELEHLYIIQILVQDV